MSRLLTIMALLLAAAACGCGGDGDAADGGLDAATDADADTDADTDGDTDGDTDADADSDADADADSDADSDADGGGDCPYECVYMFTCSGTEHDEYDCGLGMVCCETGDAGPIDAGPPCPWSCESLLGGCDGIGHQEYGDCDIGNVCCEPAPADAGTGDCEDEGMSCEGLGFPLCDGDDIYFYLDGCADYTEMCCG